MVRRKQRVASHPSEPRAFAGDLGFVASLLAMTNEGSVLDAGGRKSGGVVFRGRGLLVA